MIQEYFRPKNVQEAISLKEKYPKSLFIGGGTSINTIDKDFVFIDLQDLPKFFTRKKTSLIISSTITLEKIYQEFRDFKDLTNAIQIETGKNLRNQITLGGLVKMADGRSPLLTCLLALDTLILLEPEKQSFHLTKFLENRAKNNGLIDQLEIKIPNDFKFESVARSPLDKPIVCCAVAKYENNLGISIGGFGKRPLSVKPEIVNDSSSLDKYLKQNIKNDEWASVEYRIDVAKILVNRLLSQLR